MNGIPGTAFSLKSPIALVKLRLPLTLPSIIFPPLLIILSSYLFKDGLWSSDNAIDSLFFMSADLESPALAIYILSGEINTTFAVHPAANCYYVTFCVLVVWHLYIIC